MTDQCAVTRIINHKNSTYSNQITIMKLDLDLESRIKVTTLLDNF